MTAAAQRSEPPLRVGLCIQHFPPDFGGHGLMVHRTLPLLGRHGIELDVVTMKLAGGSEEDDSSVHRILDRGERGVDAIRRFFELRKFLRHNLHRYDLLHCVMGRSEAILNLGLAKARGIPVLYEMNLLGGNDPDSISRTTWGRRKVDLLSKADAWAGVSRGFLPSVRQVGYPEERFHVVYGAVDVEAFRPADAELKAELRRRLQLPADGRVAISVGSVIPRKGMDRVLDAWRALRPRPGRDLLVILGPSTAADRLTAAEVLHANEIRALAESPELEGTVRMQGRVHDVEEHMRAADVFVFLSRREGLGLVIVEAMASGLPCVVSPLDGIAAEMVTEGETGFIVGDPDDPGRVMEPLRRLLEDPELRRRQGAAGRRVAQERFSMHARAEATAALYRELTSRDRG